MQKKGANISLKGYDDIFSTDQSRAEAQQERVQEIPLSDLHPFEGHPFRVVDDEEMLKTAESVREFGVLTPAIVRPDPDGGYEIISGHRRHRASELAGKETIGYAGGLCLPEVCTALRGAAQTVYQYSVAGGYEKCFNYRGMELFDQRACLIISDVEQAVLDEIKTTYETELWLMEDMNFAIVRCVSMLIGSDDTGYVTEYRAFKKILKSAEDLFFSPEELIEELESMCVPQWEHEATIYEL